MWAVRIAAGSRVGTGVAVSKGLVLTCEHVVRDASVAYVRTATSELVPYMVVERDTSLDVALLEPAVYGSEHTASEPLIPRRLRRGRLPETGSLFVALATDEFNTPRTMQIEMRPAPLDSAGVPFSVTQGREGVRHGYSGGPVVELAPHLLAPRLIGLVRARDETSVDAFDNAGVGWFVPMDSIAERFDSVRQMLELPFEQTAPWQELWEPRSRGVAKPADTGFFFTGRSGAYNAVWRHAEGGRGILLLTGPPGSGKSALLGRLMALGSPRYLLSLGDDYKEVVDGALIPTAPVDAAVLAAETDVGGVGAELAEQLGLGAVPVNTLAETIRRRSWTPTLVIDAADRAFDPSLLVHQLLLPFASSGCKLIVAAASGALEAELEGRSTFVDLSQDRDRSVIGRYISKRLVAASYSADQASAITRRLESDVGESFAAAELYVRAICSGEPADMAEWQSTLPRDASGAFEQYLSRIQPDRSMTITVLQPLAYCSGDGIRLDGAGIWEFAANALRPVNSRTVDFNDLSYVAQNVAAYLETNADGRTRLYHDGLVAAIRRLGAIERIIARAEQPLPVAIDREIEAVNDLFVSCLLERLPSPDAPADAYSGLDDYLLKRLPLHLADTQRLRELVARPGLLVAADAMAVQRAVSRVAISAESDVPERTAILHALARKHQIPSARAAALATALRQAGHERLAAAVEDSAGIQALRVDLEPTDPSLEPEIIAGGARPAPFQLVQGPEPPPALASFQHEHRGQLRALAVTTNDGSPLLVTGGGEGAVRSFRIDGTMGALDIPAAHRRGTSCLLIVEHEGEPLVISAGFDGGLRSWYLDGTEGPLSRRHCHRGAVIALTSTSDDDGLVVITGGADGAVRSWDLTGAAGRLQVLRAHLGRVNALTVTEHNYKPLVVSAGRDCALRSWYLDGSHGPLQVALAHRRWIRTVAITKDRFGPLVVTGGGDRAIKSWRLDGTPGPLHDEKAHPGRIFVLTTLEDDAGPLVLSAADDTTIHSWRPDGRAGQFIRRSAHRRWINALAHTESDGARLIFSAGDDGTVRTWLLNEMSSAHRSNVIRKHGIGSIGLLKTAEQRILLVAGGMNGDIETWLADGTKGPWEVIAAHRSRIRALAVVEHEGESLIVTGGFDGALRSWTTNGEDGPLSVKKAHRKAIAALTVCPTDSMPLVVSGCLGGVLRSWHLDGSPGPLEQTHAKRKAITGLATAEYEDRTLVIVAGDDRSLTSWELDGALGPLNVDRAHSKPLRAITVARQEERQVVITADTNGAIKSWSLDGTPGAFTRGEPEHNNVGALAIAYLGGEPLVVTGDGSGALRSYWLHNRKAGPVGAVNAHTSAISALLVTEIEDQLTVITTTFTGEILVHGLSRKWYPRRIPRGSRARKA